METINNVCPCHLFHKQDLGKAEEQNPQRLGILSERQKYNRTGFHSKNPCRKSNFITAGHLCHYNRYVCQLSITVSRNILLNQLEYILEPHEMRMLHLLINEVKLNVRIGHTIGKEILTNVGCREIASQHFFSFSLWHTSSIR